MDVSQFLKDYGGHLLGLLGIVQLWAIAAWKRFLRRGTLSVYETANIEIGFSAFGPTVTLLGTLRAQNKDIFIQRMRLRVVRASDRAEHTFTWRAFRPSVLALSGAQQGLEIAGSFLVSTTAPQKYNVFFASAAFASQYESHVQPFRDSWQRFLYEQRQHQDTQVSDTIAQGQQDQSPSAALFNQFIGSVSATALYTAVSNGFFWHAGSYELELQIETDRSQENLVKHWGFAIVPDDEQRLRLNIITLIRELCDLPVVYNFLYKDYVLMNAVF